MFQKAIGLVKNSLFVFILVGWLEVGEKRRFPPSILRRFLESLISLCWLVGLAKRRKKKKTDLVIINFACVLILTL